MVAHYTDLILTWLSPEPLRFTHVMDSLMFQLQTFGSVDLRNPTGQSVQSVLAQPRRMALLLYLAAVAPQRFHRRDALLALLWPESDAAQGRAALSQAIYFLRRSLCDSVVISRGKEDVSVDAAHLQCDVLSFEAALQAGRKEEALALYGGNFLEGFHVPDAPEFERWVESQRARFREQARSAALGLSKEKEAARDLGGSLRWARAALAIVPMDEVVLRQLLSVLGDAGECGEALREYEAFTERLRSELALEPSVETQALVQELRSSGAITLVAAGISNQTIPPGDSEVDPAGARADIPAVSVARVNPVLPHEDGLSPYQQRKPIRRGVVSAALATATLVGLGASAWYLSESQSALAATQRASTAPAVERSIAVLPFVNMSSDPEQEYFSDGITEELLNVLARLPQLRVPARTSSFSFKGKDVGIDSIARALKVRHILEGSVRKSGDQVRVKAQLIDAETGYHLWGQTYDRKLSDVFAVQDEIAREIVNRLRLELPRAEGPLANEETRDPEAHMLVLKAVEIRKRATPEAFAQAEALLKQALQRDSRYARAYAELATVYDFSVYYGYAPAEASYAKARDLSRRALALNPGELRAHLVLASLALVQDWNWVAAERHYAQAVKSNPGSAAAYIRQAWLLMRLGRTEESLAAVRRAVELEPIDGGSYANLGEMHVYAGQPDKAREALLEAHRLKPDNPIGLMHLTLIESLLDRHQEAIRWAERARRAEPKSQFTLGALAYAHARAGNRALAERALAELRDLPGTSAYMLATAHAGLGNREQALHQLEKAVEQHDAPFVSFLGVDPVFRNYQAEPRVQRLLKEMRLD